ncbi:copper homeostasis protein CutC [Cohnella sp.]|uniref:copper homeostasis protein CutC n=1 Tax=Cohnella sp. TaxID=1883426 RepID=UPI0035654435
MLLEVIATCADDIVKANSGGADRIELVTGLQEGGMSPSLGLLEAAVNLSAVPVHVMIRPHSRSFHYDPDDVRIMVKDIGAVRRAGAAGIVLGALQENGRVDKDTLKLLLEAAEDLSVTFHRAFDETRDLDEALDDLLAFPVDRILTSGGKPSVLQAMDTIGRLVKRTQGTRLRILAGSGLTIESLPEFIMKTEVKEFHFGRGVRAGMLSTGQIDPELVRRIKQSIS